MYVGRWLAGVGVVQSQAAGCEWAVGVGLWEWGCGAQYCTVGVGGAAPWLARDLSAVVGLISVAAPTLLPPRLQVWSLGNPTANMTLEGHEKGVNCVDYYSGGQQWGPMAWPEGAAMQRGASSSAQQGAATVLWRELLALRSAAQQLPACLRACSLLPPPPSPFLQAATAPTWCLAPTTGWSRFGTTRPRPASKPWTATATTSPPSAFTQSCPSLPPAPRTALSSCGTAPPTGGLVGSSGNFQSVCSKRLAHSIQQLAVGGTHITAQHPTFQPLKALLLFVPHCCCPGLQAGEHAELRDGAGVGAGIRQGHKQHRSGVSGGLCGRDWGRSLA